MFSKFRQWFFGSIQPIKPKTNLEIALSQLEHLNPYAFKNVQSSDLSVFMLKVPYLSIVKYKDTLKRVTFAIGNDETLFKIDFLNLEFKDISIGDFFLSEEGSFLDEVEEVQEFIQAAKAFLIIYQEGIDDLNSSITCQHNIRILRFVYQNLMLLIDRFSQIR